MSGPVPAPRTTILGGKKPIPVPRTTVPVRVEEEHVDDETSAMHVNHNAHGEEQNDAKDTTDSTINAQQQQQQHEPDDFNVFHTIMFDSPIRPAESIYSNVSSGDFNSVNGSYGNHAEEDVDEEDSPPPPYPPPPLPSDDTYDQPSVISSSSSEEQQIRPKHVDYESVYPNYPYNSDSDSCVDMTAGTIDRHVRVASCESWNFYDSTAKEKRPQEEPTYNNVDNTPPMPVNSSSESGSFQRTNSLYENCEIRGRRSPTQSVLLEFDPFAGHSGSASGYTRADELSELEKILQDDPDAPLDMDSLSIFDDMSEPDDIYISPPLPPVPTRYDSLMNADSLSLPSSSPKPERRTPAKEPPGARKTSWYLGPTSTEATSPNAESKTQKLFKKFNEFIVKAPELVKGLHRRDNVLARPMILPKQGTQQKGMLFKIMNGPVEDLFGELNARWCVLQPGLLLCHSDNSCDNVKEHIPIESILSIQIVQDPKIKYKHEEDELYCFELNIAGKVRAGHIYGTKSQSERRVWMQNIADNMCHKFESGITSDYKRIGWTYMRVGVTGQWKGAWICLARRKLHYIDDNTTLKALDLRKARYFKLEPFDESSSPSTTDKGPNIVIHFTTETCYFRMWTHRETKSWCHLIKTAAKDNGPKLNQQQLTKNDVPVIVEKCINFVYVHGSMAEGIYRRAGSNSTVADLTTQFRTDAWGVQLTAKYTAHDVANVLKRFFRELAVPLIDSSKRVYLYQVSLVKNKDEKVRMYKGIFDQVHKISKNTIRRLLGHLHFIASQSSKNMMTVTNLASIWGPTLLHGAENDGNKDRLIIKELIELYKDIFPEEQREREQEQKMLDILNKYSSQPWDVVNNVKPSGDFRVWVYLYNKDGKTFNMLVGPHKTAYAILSELSGKVNVPVHELVLEELVLNDHLTRPIHHTEKVLDVVMKWSYWDEDDRKDNCLILNNISKYWEYIADNHFPLSGELKYADNKSKSFKSYKFEFQQAKLTYYKDRQSSNMLGQWNIEDVFVYFGSEPKRSASFAMTFFPRNEYPKRNKTRPYFGHVLCFPDATMKATWVSTMWRAEHQHNVMPPPQHVNLMSS